MNNLEKFIELLELKVKEITSQEIKVILGDVDVSDEVLKFWSISNDFMIDYASFISPFTSKEYFQETIEDLAMNFDDEGLSEYVQIDGGSEENKAIDSDELFKNSEIPVEVKKTNYNQKWFPVFVEDGVYVLFDFDPTSQGRQGQLIVKDIMSGDASVSLVSFSFNEIINTVNQKLVTDELILSDCNGTKRIHYEDESKSIFSEMFLSE